MTAVAAAADDSAQSTTTVDDPLPQSAEAAMQQLIAEWKSGDSAALATHGDGKFAGKLGPATGDEALAACTATPAEEKLGADTYECTAGPTDGPILKFLVVRTTAGNGYVVLSVGPASTD